METEPIGFQIKMAVCKAIQPSFDIYGSRGFKNLIITSL